MALRGIYRCLSYVQNIALRPKFFVHSLKFHSSLSAGMIEKCRKDIYPWTTIFALSIGDTSMILKMYPSICASLNHVNMELPPQLIKDNFTLPNQNGKPSLVYISPFAYQEKVDPLITEKEIVDKSIVVEKEAAKMLRVRRKKMKKHKLKKLRKRMHFEWAKIRFKREKRKEQLFTAELYGQIKEVENFNAEQYVKHVLQKIRDRPKPETEEEKFEKYQDLRRKYRSNVNVIPPKRQPDD